MPPDSASPILVTGSHRSGTTITGRLLSVRSHVGYVREPFHKYAGMTEIERWWPYVREEHPDEDRYRRAVERLLAGRATYKRLPLDESGVSLPKRIARVFLKSTPNVEYWKAVWDPRVSRYLIKDPLACLASEYLHRRFDMDVVVLVRHPAAFVASLKRVDWRFDFGEFRNQSALMDDYLAPLLREANPPFDSLVREGTLLWRCFYTVLFDYMDRNPEMIALRHEDLSRSPLRVTERLYDRLDLPFSAKVRRYVDAMTGAHNPAGPRDDHVHSLRRDSRANLERWKQTLGDDEIAFVRDETAELADRFYDESDW